jgi:hypothetical protein
LFSNAGGRPKDLIAEVETRKPARCLLFYFLPANTARQLVGISVGIGSNRH